MLLASLATAAAFPLEGFFIDVTRWWGNFGGIVVLTEFDGGVVGIGTWDDSDFWVIHGTWDEARTTLLVDFNQLPYPGKDDNIDHFEMPPPGTPLVLHGQVQDVQGVKGVDRARQVTFSDSPRTMTRRWFEAFPPLSPGSVRPSEGDFLPPLEGFYLDPNHYSTSKGGLGGGRWIAEGEGDSVFMVGTDDAVKYWLLNGTYIDRRERKFVFDFTPKLSEEQRVNRPDLKALAGAFVADAAAAGHGNAIRWSDGSKWVRQYVEIMQPADLGPTARKQYGLERL